MLRWPAWLLPRSSEAWCAVIPERQAIGARLAGAARAVFDCPFSVVHPVVMGGGMALARLMSQQVGAAGSGRFAGAFDSFL